MNREHVDLEEKFQLSADVQFQCTDLEPKLQPMEIEIKKKETAKSTIENVELRKSGGLF